MGGARLEERRTERAIVDPDPARGRGDGSRADRGSQPRSDRGVRQPVGAVDLRHPAGPSRAKAGRPGSANRQDNSGAAPRRHAGGPDTFPLRTRGRQAAAGVYGDLPRIRREGAPTAAGEASRTKDRQEGGDATAGLIRPWGARHRPGVGPGR